MKEFKVYINDEQIDLYDSSDLDLAITKAIADANDLNVRKKTNTKTLSFPATNTNKQIFGFPEDINSIVSINQSTKPVVKIEANGTVIFTGIIKVEAVSNLDDKVIEYTGTCLGDNGDWISLLGDKKLNELDYSDQNHTNDWITVTNSEVQNLEYVYDLIDRGQFSGQDYTANGTTRSGVNIQDRFPALKMLGLFERSLNSIGYKLSSTFLNSTFFGKLFFPFVNEELKHPDTFNADLVTKVQSNTVQKVTSSPSQTIHFKTLMGAPQTVFYNVSGAWEKETGSEYFCLGSGKHTIKITVNFTARTFGLYGNTGSYGHVFFTIMKRNRTKDGIAYAASPNSTSPIQIMTATSLSGIVTFTKEVELEYGDEVYLDSDLLYTQVLGGAGGEYLQINQYIFEVVKVDGSLGMGENQYVDWAYNLPDIYCLDFIKGVKELFNLHFTPDTGSRTLYVEPRDTFYTGATQDWSALVDKSREVGVEFLGSSLSKTMRYKFKNDSNDTTVNNWNKKNNAEFGSEDATVTNAFAKDGMEDIENTIFAATWMDKCERIGLDSAVIPRMWNGDNLPKRSQSFVPRVLYYAGQTSVPNSGYWRFNRFASKSWQTAHPITDLALGGRRNTYPRFFSFDDTGVNDNCLLYSDTNYSSGLQQKYYRNAQKAIDDGRRYNIYINLSDARFSRIDFRQPIYIEIDGNGAYFILEKIENYSSQDGVSTLCSMTKIIPTTPLKVLRYNTNKPLFSYNGGYVGGVGTLPSTVLSTGGTPVIVGKNKSFFLGGVPVLTNINGIISPVYYLDSVDGLYKPVIM